MTLEPQNTELLLVIHQGALGDVITTFPALLLLRKRFGRIDLICQHNLGKLSCHLGITENFYGLESAVFAALFSRETDRQNNRLSRILNLYDKILNIGFSDVLPDVVQNITGKISYRISPRPLPCMRFHVSRHIVSQLEELGLLVKDGINSIGATFKDYRHKEYDPLKIIIHPGSGSLRKNWPFQNFVALMRMLQTKGYKPVAVIGPAEKNLVEKIRKGVHPLISKDLPSFTKRIIAPRNLVELAEVLKSAGGYIGNDSGASHLAAFLGLPTVSIFGPTDPARWRPQGLHSVAVLAEKSCNFCFEESHKPCDHLDCLVKISPEQVMAAFLVCLEKAEKKLSIDTRCSSFC